ncbi:MAG: response regulator [Candidatus Scalindua sp.]|nr:response regulator [Candidatus Scalindua sp.]
MTTLLCIDDDKNRLLRYEQEFGFEGYEVITAANGREALDKAQDLHPDIILMDTNNLQVGDLEAIGRIIGKNRRDPIIVHTAYSDKRGKFISWAVDAHLVKTPDLSELKSTIEELLTDEPESLYYNEIINM